MYIGYTGGTTLRIPNRFRSVGVDVATKTYGDVLLHGCGCNPRLYWSIVTRFGYGNVWD